MADMAKIGISLMGYSQIITEMDIQRATVPNVDVLDVLHHNLVTYLLITTDQFQQQSQVERAKTGLIPNPMFLVIPIIITIIAVVRINFVKTPGVIQQIQMLYGNIVRVQI